MSNPRKNTPKLDLTAIVVAYAFQTSQLFSFLDTIKANIQKTNGYRVPKKQATNIIYTAIGNHLDQLVEKENSKPTIIEAALDLRPLPTEIDLESTELAISCVLQIMQNKKAVLFGDWIKQALEYHLQHNPSDLKAKAYLEKISTDSPAPKQKEPQFRQQYRAALHQALFLVKRPYLFVRQCIETALPKQKHVNEHAFIAKHAKTQTRKIPNLRTRIPRISKIETKKIRRETAAVKTKLTKKITTTIPNTSFKEILRAQINTEPPHDSHGILPNLTIGIQRESKPLPLLYVATIRKILELQYYDKVTRAQKNEQDNTPQSPELEASFLLACYFGLLHSQYMLKNHRQHYQENTVGILGSIRSVVPTTKAHTARRDLTKYVKSHREMTKKVESLLAQPSKARFFKPKQLPDYIQAIKNDVTSTPQTQSFYL